MSTLVLPYKAAYHSVMYRIGGAKAMGRVHPDICFSAALTPLF